MPKGDEGFLAEVEALLNELMKYPNGTLKLLEICQRYAGTEVYIPSRTEAYLQYRAAQIRTQYNGSNAAQLGEQFGLCEKRVREIIKNGIGRSA